jgi:hypothetical protein
VAYPAGGASIKRVGRRIVPFFFGLLLASPATASSWQQELLALHNRERAAKRLAPLTWDAGLAASADRWAAELSRRNQWGHSPSSARTDQGENLWMGTSGAYQLAAMVGSWTDERRWFRPGVFPAVSTTGDWSSVGHYSQMISPRTTRVGCAIRDNNSWTYLVCRYYPSGNLVGLRIP